MKLNAYRQSARVKSLPFLKTTDVLYTYSKVWFYVVKGINAAQTLYRCVDYETLEITDHIR